jgi:hypothetical protein
MCALCHPGQCVQTDTDLSVKGDGLLVESLRVADVGKDDFAERVLRRAICQLLQGGADRKENERLNAAEKVSGLDKTREEREESNG